MEIDVLILMGGMIAAKTLVIVYEEGQPFIYQKPSSTKQSKR
jgi:hypothetical protein